MDVAEIPRNSPGNPITFRDFGGTFFWILQKFLGICVKFMDVSEIS